MAENTFPFRRMTKALKIPVAADSASNFAVPEGFVKPDYNAFMVVNCNNCWVSLRGASKVDGQAAPTASPPAEDDDWMFAPGFSGVFSTQYPMFMSARAFDMPGVPLPGVYVPLRLYYGYGS